MKPNENVAATGENEVHSTRRQKNLARMYVANPELPQSEIVRRAGFSEATAWGHARQMIEAPGTQAEIKRLLDRAGVTDDVLAQRHAEALNYTAVQRIKVRDGDNGETVEEFVDVDNAGRLKAIELGYKLRGFLRESSDFAAIGALLVACVRESLAFVEAARRADFIALWERAVESIQAAGGGPTPTAGPNGDPGRVLTATAGDSEPDQVGAGEPDPDAEVAETETTPEANPAGGVIETETAPQSREDARGVVGVQSSGPLPGEGPNVTATQQPATASPQPDPEPTEPRGPGA